MKIRKIVYKDNNYDWKLEETSFNDNLTLLVGASGVGKTRILKALLSLQEVARGESIKGVEWNLQFETLSGKAYEWIGKFENNKDAENESDLSSIIGFPFTTQRNKRKYNFIEESLLSGDEIIFERNWAETTFNGGAMPKLSPAESLLSILKEEDSIKPIFEEFSLLHFNDQTASAIDLNSIITVLPRKEQLASYTSIEDIRKSQKKIISKLFIASQKTKTVFEQIQRRFIEVFPQVEDIKIKSIKFDKVDSLGIILIKEHGVANWIDQNRISSGMMRTLKHIADIYLCADGTVFLTDEFENSLGINCIDELTADIMMPDMRSRKIQFIITSHHPYIINNINFSHWKLVTRTGNVVRTTPITNYVSGESSHDKFIQLIQLAQYQTGLDNPDSE